MRRILPVIAFLCLVSSCGLTHHTPTTVIEYRDTTIIRERLVHDTVKVSVPEIIERNVTTDTTSHLENDWAKSDASVRAGLLFHSLETKPHTIEVPVLIPVHDTIRIEKEAHTEIQTVKVEKPLSFWQRLKIGAFWWLLGAVAILLLWTFRKTLFKIL